MLSIFPYFVEPLALAVLYADAGHAPQVAPLSSLTMCARSSKEMPYTRESSRSTPRTVTTSVVPT